MVGRAGLHAVIALIARVDVARCDGSDSDVGRPAAKARAGPGVVLLVCLSERPSSLQRLNLSSSSPTSTTMSASISTEQYESLIQASLDGSSPSCSSGVRRPSPD